MKIIFLDFDDVINSSATKKINFTWPDSGTTSRVRGIDDFRVALVNDIFTQAGPGVKVVICSSWRRYHDMDELKSFLWGAGAVFVDDIIGLTPVQLYELEREDEIDAWFEQHYAAGGEELEAFVILDNEACPSFHGHHTRPQNNVGLLIKHVHKSVQILGKPVSPWLTRTGREKKQLKLEAETAARLDRMGSKKL